MLARCVEKGFARVENQEGENCCSELIDAEGRQRRDRFTMLLRRNEVLPEFAQSCGLSGHCSARGKEVER